VGDASACMAHATFMRLASEGFFVKVYEGKLRPYNSLFFIFWFVMKQNTSLRRSDTS
jgi:hypothetical protein